jgi:hypothetical protein
MAARAKRLTDRIRAEIIVRFACCDSVEEVRNWLKDDHGIVLTPPSLSYYNGNNPAAHKALSRKWRTLFDETREEYLNAIRAPIAFKAHRLRLANDAAERVVAKLGTKTGINIVLLKELRDLLEYAAKEDGGLFTNKRRLDVEPREALARMLGIPVSELPEDPDAAGS